MNNTNKKDPSKIKLDKFIKKFNEDCVEFKDVKSNSFIDALANAEVKYYEAVAKQVERTEKKAALRKELEQKQREQDAKPFCH